MGDTKMPVLFLGHGSPMNIILDNDFTASLKDLGRSLPIPEAIMVISAHWLTDGTSVGCQGKPRTIHDFYGFPRELYRIRYAAPGAPAYARKAMEAVKTATVKCDESWGLDHASWSVLQHIYPDASIPVFEMSLHYSFNEWHPKPLRYHYDLAAGLRELRRQGVLIIGSGNIVHNLGRIDMDIDAHPYDWAVEFDEKVKAGLLRGDDSMLLDYSKTGQGRYSCGANARPLPTDGIYDCPARRRRTALFHIRRFPARLCLHEVFPNRLANSRESSQFVLKHESIKALHKRYQAEGISIEFPGPGKAGGKNHFNGTCDSFGLGQIRPKN